MDFKPKTESRNLIFSLSRFRKSLPFSRWIEENLQSKNPKTGSHAQIGALVQGGGRIGLQIVFCALENNCESLQRYS